jgi:hypothetical protein
LQIKKIVSIDEGEETIKENLKNCIFKRKWRHDFKNALHCSFYYVNDNKPVDVNCFQLKRCFYASPILISNTKTQARKGLILYNSAKGIIAKKCSCRPLYDYKNI